MRTKRRVRQSVDSVLAEERRDWERQSLARGLVRELPKRSSPPRMQAAWRLVPALGLAASGMAGGLVTGELPTCAAAGIVLALFWLSATRHRQRQAPP